MERLTNKVFDDKGNQQKIYECSSVSDLKIQTKLGEFEDFMEEQGFESLGDLKNTVSNIEKLMLIAAKTTNLKEENQSLKDRWEKLKEYIIKEINKEGDGDFACAEEDILDKMRELELTDLIRRKEE